MGVLRDGGIQIVLDHQHDSGRLLALRRVVADGPGMHRIGRAVSVHVDAAVVLEFLGKFGGELGVQGRWEIPQSVLECKPFLGPGQDVFANRGVGNGRVEPWMFGKRRRNAF